MEEEKVDCSSMLVAEVDEEEFDCSSISVAEVDEEEFDYSNMSVAEKVKHFESSVVESPLFTGIIDRIKECHRRAKYTTEPRGLLITGDTGYGKTTLGRFYEKDYPRVKGDDGMIIPVLFSSVPSPATIKNMGSALLKDLGDPLYDRGTTGNITSRLCNLIKECKVELIILDEFQDLIDKDTERVLKSCADWIKTLLNKTGVPIVLMGMPWAADILIDNAQLQRRFSTRMALRAYGWETEDEQTEFTNFLIILEQGLLFPSPSMLYSGEKSFRLFCATRGVIANMKNLISKAAEKGYEKGFDCITMDLLALAYDEELAHGEAGNSNPFRIATENLQIPPEPIPEEPMRVRTGSRRGRHKGKKKKENISTLLRK